MCVCVSHHEVRGWGRELRLVGVHIYSSVSRGSWGGGQCYNLPPSRGSPSPPPPPSPGPQVQNLDKGLRISALWFQFCLRRRVSQEPMGAGPGQRGAGSSSGSQASHWSAAAAATAGGTCRQAAE